MRTTVPSCPRQRPHTGQSSQLSWVPAGPQAASAPRGQVAGQLGTSHLTRVLHGGEVPSDAPSWALEWVSTLEAGAQPLPGFHTSRACRRPELSWVQNPAAKC